jgi:uncharacterized membrane protein YfcA
MDWFFTFTWEESSLVALFLLAAFSFIAGFIDAVVGGGGLIVVPYLLIAYPKTPLPFLFGTNKLAALSGTSVAAVRYTRKIKFDYPLLIFISVVAFAASFTGAGLVSRLNSEMLKPFILIVLVVTAVYTFTKKDFGVSETKQLSRHQQFLFASFFSVLIGFYDGFFGPGTGSFFVLAFVAVMGFDFLKASAYSKLVNCITNISALMVFIKNGQCVYQLALWMAVFNMAGSFTGSSLALKKGNIFIRKVFLFIVSLLILKFGWDLFSN